ncbi:hypothetical protein EPN28_04825 [Patescibacteria group bacterium]|nr:MAG: hypothetical protein EPN28_04825 [Patescibacteria group bacterium]
MRKLVIAAGTLLGVFIFSLALVMPAKAFYLNIPEYLKSFISRVTAQETTTVAPAPQTTQTTQPKPVQTYEPQPIKLNEPVSPYPQQTQTNQQPMNSDSTAWCMVNGVRMSGPCSNYPNAGGQGQPGDQQGGQQGGMREGDMKQMQRSIKQMESNLSRFKKMMVDAEKKGSAAPQEAKDNVIKLQAVIDSAKQAKTPEEMGDIDWSEMQNLSQALEETRRDVFEAAQRMDGMKRGMKGAEQGIKMFEKQLSKLAKQKIAVPAEVSDNLAKLKALIALVKNAKTWEEVEGAGVEDMGDMFQSLDQYREQLETLSRWPQTKRDINRQIAEMERGVKRAKTMAARLAKKGVDVSANLAQFEEAVNKLKAVRDEAAGKIEAGQGREGFDLLENDFFGQTDDAWQNMKIIDMMSNLGRFASEFKRDIAEGQRMIKTLQRKKIDVSELQDILGNAKAKGQEILDMIKGGDVDEDMIISIMEEMETYGQEFEQKFDELTGGGEDMPWEKGPKQFQEMKAPSVVSKYLPRKQSREMEGGPEGGPGQGPMNGGPQDSGPMNSGPMY